jgi:hypothetical protein
VPNFVSAYRGPLVFEECVAAGRFDPDRHRSQPDVAQRAQQLFGQKFDAAFNRELNPARQLADLLSQFQCVFASGPKKRIAEFERPEAVLLPSVPDFGSDEFR